MDIKKESEQSVSIVLAPADVESAVRQFICECKPEYSKGWIIDPVNQLHGTVFHATKE